MSLGRESLIGRTWTEDLANRAMKDLTMRSSWVYVLPSPRTQGRESDMRSACFLLQLKA